MDFIITLAAIAGLAFEFKFPVTLESDQDCFYLEGNEQSAHLFRRNGTINLHLSQGSNYTVYTSQTNQPSFTFSWTGFKVDGVAMTLNNSLGTVTKHQYHSFAFFSPIIGTDSVTCLNTKLEPAFRIDGIAVNYWYIVLIVFLVCALFEYKGMGFDAGQQFFNRLLREEMQFEPVSTPTPALQTVV